MRKIAPRAFGIALGVVAGVIGRKIFQRLWALADDQEPPSPEHRNISWPKFVVALPVEGAIFRAVRGLIDRGSRSLYSRATGTWPGEEQPEQA